MDEEVNVKVAVRSRPINASERELQCEEIVAFEGTNVTAKDPNPYSSTPSYNFTFDFAYAQNSTQEQLYKDLGLYILDKAFEGYNGTIFAYGQTGSGKTHCIMGSADDIGLIPRMNKDLFKRIAELQMQSEKEFLITVSYLELYNEVIYDLLNPTKGGKGVGLKVREHPKLGVYVENLLELVVNNEEEISKKMAEGNTARHTAATKMNDRSSRSHSVFIIKLEQKEPLKNPEEIAQQLQLLGGSCEMDTHTSLSAKINLVDLAGSERVAKTEAEGSTLKEATAINQSLSALGNVINALADPKKRKGHIPFRSSKLTRLLQESLGGNTVTAMIATISPADRNFEETLNTLQYANRAKNIQNTSRKNENNPAKIVKELREQIEKLKAELAQGGADPMQLQTLRDTISDLEYAKSQTWAEKQQLSKKFEEQRWAALAKNGMLQFKVNLMKKQKLKLDDKVASLTTEKQAIIQEFEAQKELIAQLQGQLAQVVSKEQQLPTNGVNNKQLKELNSQRILEKWKYVMKQTLNEQESNKQKERVSELEQRLKEQQQQLKEIESGAKTQSLEEKLLFKDKEVELLYEELAALKKENSALQLSIEQKQRDTDSLCADVAQMLRVENGRIENLEKQLTEYAAEIERLTAENIRLRMELAAAGVFAQNNDLAPSAELGIDSMGDYVRFALRDDPQLSILFPSGALLRDSVSDGVLLCKLINKAVPGTIDERVLNINPTTPEEVIENLNLCINSAKAIGCDIADVTIEDIITGDELKILKLISEIEKIGLLASVNLKQNPDFINLKASEETVADFVKLNAEQLLLRWFNYHLKNAGRTQISNFDNDLKDSTAIAYLLHQLSPKCDASCLEISNLESRAEKMLQTAARIGCKRYIGANDIVLGNSERNLMFVANLCNTFPVIKPQDALSSAGNTLTIKQEVVNIKSDAFTELIESEVDEQREERAVRVWINSLDIGHHVKNLSEELKDGILMLKVFDKVTGGKVNWKKVNLDPVGIYKKIENCNYCVEIGKDLKFSLVGIAGKDFVDGNLKLSLALISQAMQYHFMRLIKHLRFGGKQITETDMIRYCNEKVASAGKASMIRSFKDPTIKDGRFLIDLLYAVKNSAINYELATSGKTDEERMVNAKYIISVARKIGCNIFLVWEDIAEGKYNRIQCLVGELMSRTDEETSFS